MEINPQIKPKRIYYIDWLRVMAVALLILFHTARIFDIWDPFYAKNATTSPFLSYTVITFLTQWQIPLLFLLAGESANRQIFLGGHPVFPATHQRYLVLADCPTWLWPADAKLQQPATEICRRRV